MNTETFYKYQIDRNQSETSFSVIVSNLNAKKESKRIKYWYTFSTNEKREEWINNFKKNVEDWEKTKILRRATRKTTRETGITTILKKALAGKYGYRNVKVTRGTGTAWGWVHASVTLDKKAPSCEMDKDSVYGKCYKCGESARKDNIEITEFIYKTLKENNLKFYTYCSDDGYNTDRDEFMLNVEYTK